MIASGAKFPSSREDTRDESGVFSAKRALRTADCIEQNIRTRRLDVLIASSLADCFFCLYKHGENSRQKIPNLGSKYKFHIETENLAIFFNICHKIIRTIIQH
jgi:hypothetical protein